MAEPRHQRTAAQVTTYEIIFGTDTRAGKLFDVALLIAIVTSVIVVMLDSVRGIREDHGGLLRTIEWIFTALFTIEYGLRLWCAQDRRRYAFSFFGLIDFLGMVPTYIGLILHGSHYLVVVRFLRILRTFRILKLTPYQRESIALVEAFRAARHRITVFLLAVLTVVVVLGSLMYVLEGEANGFSSIPQSIYWAIVTLTTVGYGDISPQTPFGQAIAALLMILGYSIIVVPTGIMSAEVVRGKQPGEHPPCPGCGEERLSSDARYCHGCGERLP